MKLTEFPEREERMKNYRSARRNLYIYIVLSLIILVGATSVIPKSDLPVAIAAALLITGIAAAAVTGRVSRDLSRIPNGRPRPEDELQRRVPLLVDARVTNTQIILCDAAPRLRGLNPTFWQFEMNVPKEAVVGTTIVYLDDIASEYLAAWEKEGVIPILSAQGRAKKEKSDKSQPQTVDIDRIRERLERKQAGV